MKLLVVDLFPPTPRDPQGIHGAIWDELAGEPFELPPRQATDRRALPRPADDRPRCAYSVLVSRAERRLDVGFWPISIRERLPEIPVPVRAPDPDARLDSQAALDRVCDDAGYADYIYEGTPRPRLGKKDAEWALSLLSRTSS